jgi:hypothetical protein
MHTELLQNFYSGTFSLLIRLTPQNNLQSRVISTMLFMAYYLAFLSRHAEYYQYLKSACERETSLESYCYSFP